MIPRLLVNVLYVVSLILCAIALRKMIHFINVENRVGDKEFTDYDPNLIIQDGTDHLQWFIQISDIHISKFHKPSRATDLKEFCRTNIDAVRPGVVLVSGDITDAKVPLSFWSEQYEEEWVRYREAIDESGVLEKTKWLDARGNHDTFDVSSVHSPKNFFRRYGVQGKEHPNSYMYTYKKGSDSVAFVAVDTCLQPGPRWPFNFFGKLDAKEMDALQELSLKSRSANFTIYWGHHPISCTLSPEPGLLTVMEHGLAYLSGHLHTLGEIVHDMYTIQPTGNLELELADWKHNRLYRILAIDHGLLSFVDSRYDAWPIALVTNPKNALYQMPAKEPLKRMKTSTHIRILAFSPSPIEKVRIRFAGQGSKWHTCQHDKDSLYTLPWNPNDFSTGMHSFDVHVQDSSGRTSSFTHDFSLDGSRLSFKLVGKLILLTNIALMFQIIYYVLLILCVAPLIMFRWWHGVIRRRGDKAPNLRPCFRKLWIMSTVDRIFYTIIFYCFYLSFGPWFVGEMIEGYMGVVFLWGSFIGSHFMPGSLTYLYGIEQLVFFVFPLILSVSHRVHERFRSHTVESPRLSLRAKLSRHSPMMYLFLFHVLQVYYFYTAYNTVYFLLFSLVMWSFVISIALWRESAVLPANCLRNAAMVWNLVPGQEQQKIS